MTQSVDEVQSMNEQLEKTIRLQSQNLTKEQKTLLSKVLFPESHNEKIDVLKKTRTLKPLTIKYSRKFSEILAPLSTQIEDIAAAKGPAQVVDQEILSGLKECTLVLCEYYGKEWDDIKLAVEQDDVVITELQHILMQQQLLQGTNDFLLAHLRAILLIMQYVELASIRQRVSSQIRLDSNSTPTNMISSSTPDSLATGIAPSTS